MPQSICTVAFTRYPVRMSFPEFNLVNLLNTVFHPKSGERIAVFIDLPNPRDVVQLKFLENTKLATQHIGYYAFYQKLLSHRKELPFSKVDFYAFAPTGGSNLELPPTVVTPEGKELNLIDEVLSSLDIALYLSTYSATAPLTSLAKKMGFRGATMHGCNETILRSGLSQDYDQVSIKAERFRQAVTKCEKVTVEFETAGETCRLNLDLDCQEAQKSHGLCRTPGEIANLPAGEIYWVPTNAQGKFPMKFKDGTLATMNVERGRIQNGTLLRGSPKVLEHAINLFKTEPATGQLGELGLGTQVLPVSGADIQDEKILGTMHIATGRDDHLGGPTGPDKFKDQRNATHEDILFAPHKTPEIRLNGLWMQKNGSQTLLLKDYEPTEFVKSVAL